jgi:hypothetical protein
MESNEDLARSRPVEIDLLDDQRLGELLEDGGADLHGADLNALRNLAAWASVSRAR